MKKKSQFNLFNEDLLTIDELFRRSKKYQESKEFFRFFDFIARFNHYSRFNTMLVFLQDESVTFFGGAKFWETKFNRTVIEDARPYVILQPFAPVMLVYDIFQTEGVETPHQFLERGLGKKPFDVSGSINPQILDEAIEIAKSFGIDVLFKPLSYFDAGYVTNVNYGNLRIALKEGMSYEENLAVLIHELGHLFLGHTGHLSLFQETKDGQHLEFKLAERRLSKTGRELEAETISYLICKKLGLQPNSAEYLASYIKSPSDLKEFSYEYVIKTTDKIEHLFFRKWIAL